LATLCMGAMGQSTGWRLRARGAARVRTTTGGFGGESLEVTAPAEELERKYGDARAGEALGRRDSRLG